MQTLVPKLFASSGIASAISGDSAERQDGSHVAAAGAGACIESVAAAVNVGLGDFHHIDPRSASGAPTDDRY